MTLAALVLIYLVIEEGLASSRPLPQVVRVVGCWIATVGALIRAFTLRDG